MLKITPSPARVSNQRSHRHSSAPELRQSKPALADRVDLDVSPQKIVDDPSPRTGLALASLGLAALSVLAAAGPASAQLAPSLGVPVEPLTSQVQKDQPLAKGQLAEMKQVGLPLATDNDTGLGVKESYRELVSRVAEQAEQFTEVSRLLRTKASQMKGNFALFPDGSYVSISRHPGRTVIELRSADGQAMRLVENVDSVTLENGNTHSTLYLQDGFFHEAGDFVIHLGNETLATSQQHPTRIQRRSGSGEAALFETYEKPELAIAIFPNPVFGYDSRGAQQKSVTIHSDGSTRTLENGAVTLEPGAPIHEIPPP